MFVFLVEFFWAELVIDELIFDFWENNYKILNKVKFIRRVIRVILKLKFIFSTCNTMFKTYIVFFIYIFFYYCSKSKFGLEKRPYKQQYRK